MADSIEQVFGIDVAQGLRSLESLNAKFKEFHDSLTNNIRAFDAVNTAAGRSVAALNHLKTAYNEAKTASNNFNRAQKKLAPVQQTSTGTATQQATGSLKNAQAALKQTATTASQTAAAVTNATGQINQNLKGTGKQAKDTAGEVTISWKTMARVVTTQAIVRALSTLRNAFRESIGTAIDFQKAISIAQTISGGTDYGTISEDVKALAANMNLPAVQTASGLYQALSAQVGDYGETLEFTSKAAQFAKATNSSLADSVGLLSGALRSFNLDSSETESVMDQFFFAIEKGRITADQLSNTFGRIGPQAGQLGIKFEELSAAIAQISIRGLKVPETLTQFRGLMTSLIKPSEAMEASLRGMGYASVQQAIQVEGLDGVLRGLLNSTDGTSEALARLFPNVRGLGAGLALTNGNVEEFIDLIGKATNEADGLTKAALGKVLETDAEKVTKAINQIKVAFIDYGEAALSATNGFFEFVGGAGNVTSALQLISKEVVVLGGVMVTAAIATRGFTGALSVLKAHPVIAVGVAAAATALAIAHMREEASKAAAVQLVAPSTDFANFEKGRIEALTKSLKDEQKLREKSLTEATQNAGKYVATVGKEYFRLVEVARQAEDQVLKNAKDTLNQIVSVRQKVVSEMERAIADAEASIHGADFTIRGLEFQQDQISFDQSIEGLDPTRQALFQIQRSQELATRSAREYVAAVRSGDSDAKSFAQSMIANADGALKAAEAAAKQAGNATLVRQVQEQQKKLLDTRIRAEREVTQTLEGQKKALLGQVGGQKQIADDLKTLVDQFIDASKRFDSEGNQLTGKKLIEQQERRAELANKILKKAQEGLDPKGLADVGLSKLIPELERKLSTTALVASIKTSQESLDKMESDIKAALDGIEITPFLNLDKALGKDNAAQSIQDQIGRNADALDRVITFDKVNQELDITNEKFRAARDTLKTTIDSLSEAPLTAFSAFTGTVREAPQSLQQLVGALKTFRDEGVYTEESITALKEKISSIQGGDFSALDNAFSPIVDAIRQQLIPDLKNVQEQAKELEHVKAKVDVVGSPEQIEAIRSALIGLNDIKIDQPAQGLDVATSNAANSLGTAATSASTLASDAERAANAYERASRVALPKFQATGGLAKGGVPNYFASGGRGVDTIPAMLSPGEFVMNRRSSGRFFSQIQAMNAGQSPIFREEGGSVTTVGDINMTVHTNQLDQKSARQFTHEIRRELRRGTARL